MVERNISVDLYLEVNSYLATSAWFHGQTIPLSINYIDDIRQIESVLQEITLKTVSDSNPDKNKHYLLISRAREHIS